jgi:acetyl-CoA carboxylase biotin carboxyl carrier protein
LETFEFEQAGACLRLTLGDISPAPASASASTMVSPNQETHGVVPAPGMGILRLSHPQRDEPFIAPGANVEKGQVMAFLRNGILLDEVTADRAGRVISVLAEEGDLIGYGQPLFELQ